MKKSKKDCPSTFYKVKCWTSPNVIGTAKIFRSETKALDAISIHNASHPNYLDKWWIVECEGVSSFGLVFEDDEDKE